MAADVPQSGISTELASLPYNGRMSKLSISQEQVKHLARLACLRLDEDEERRMVGDIRIILDYMNVLREASLDDVSVLETAASELRDDDPCTGPRAVDAHGECGDASARGFVVPAFDARVRGPDRDDGS